MLSTRGIDTTLDQQRAVSSDLVSALESNSELLLAALPTSMKAATSAAEARLDGRQTESKAAFKVWDLPITAGKPARPESWSNTINLQKE